MISSHTCNSEDTSACSEAGAQPGIDRRQFLTRAGAAAALTAWTAKSYARIPGANSKLNFAIAGLNSRGYAHLSAIQANRADARLAYVADVDTAIMAKFTAAATKAMGEAPVAVQDFRKVLAAPDVDVLTIATPDHWHTPMAILALHAGKNVYVEKPCSYDPQEGLWLIDVVKKTGKVCQMGSQQRSSPHTIEIVSKIHNGLIGRAYWAETWYANHRGQIGTGVPAPVPATLDWDLWQGPAPRTEYLNIVQPYNWHWFRRWGTGETCNNGTHEVDIARWALDVTWPDRLVASGGRYAEQGSWQFYDTLDVAMNFPDKLLTWKGDCCNGKTTYGRDRGIAVHGTEGTVILDREGYEVWNRTNKMLDQFKVEGHSAQSSSDLVGADRMTDLHFANLIAAVRNGAPLNQPVAQGNVAVTMMQLANISYFSNRSLTLNNATGAIQHDAEAEAMTRRTYQPGWQPKV